MLYLCLSVAVCSFFPRKSQDHVSCLIFLCYYGKLPTVMLLLNARLIRFAVSGFWHGQRLCFSHHDKDGLYISTEHFIFRSSTAVAYFWEMLYLIWWKDETSGIISIYCKLNKWPCTYTFVGFWKFFAIKDFQSNGMDVCHPHLSHEPVVFL